MLQILLDMNFMSHRGRIISIIHKINITLNFGNPIPIENSEANLLGSAHYLLHC